MAAVVSQGFEVDPNAELRQRIVAVVEQGTSVTEIAERISMARATVSRFLNEPGFGSPNLIAKLQGIVAELESGTQVNLVSVTDDGFVMTKDALEIMGVCDLAAENRKLAVVVGFPGAGKTMAIDRYASRVPDTVLVRANSNMSCAGLCIRIGQQLGLDLRNGQSLDYMVDSIVSELQQKPRLVIVDEADYLATKNSNRKMELLRTIYDEAHIGMVLCGMPRLMTSLTTGLALKDNLAQFYSRVAYLRRLVGFSDDEIRTFCRKHTITDEAFLLLAKLTRHEERGGLRRLDNLLRNAALLAKDQTITLRHVKAAAEELELTRQ